MPVLTWLLRTYISGCAIQANWADLRLLPRPPKKLYEKIQCSFELWPCDLLFIHRDAEREPLERRLLEVCQEIEKAKIGLSLPPVLPVIPVRMQEAWLLFDEAALRRASGNPNSRGSLNIPPLESIENLADPKKTLYDLLAGASGRKGRRLKQFRPQEKAILVADFIDDFSPLRGLKAFRSLETRLQAMINSQGWSQ